MKIVLVKPVSDTHIITPPVCLGYLATALRKSNYEVSILDCPQKKIDFKSFESYMKNLNPDVIGFQVFSLDIYSVKRSLQIVKNINNSVITIIGGAHPSGMPKESMEYFQEADFGFAGESELGLPLLMDYITSSKKISLPEIPGLLWRHNGDIKVNQRVFIDDLDSFGIPAWDLIDPNNYPFAPHQGFAKYFPAAPIVITRGCPFLCSFCATRTITGRKIRRRSIEHVIEEIKLLYYKYKIKEIHIEDDNFTFSTSYVTEFCQRLIQEKVDVVWFCSSGIRIDTLNEEMLKLMKKSGCYTITVAIESGVQRILDLMKKQLSLEKIRRAVELIHKVKYNPIGLFMIGYPGETKEDIEQTIKFAISIPLKRAQFALFHPLPGSEVYQELVEKGELTNIQWQNLKPSKVSYVPKGLSREELKSLQKKAFLKFHLRPKILYYQLKDIQSLKHLIFLLKRIYSYLK